VGLLVVDVAARELAATVLESAGDVRRGALHRALPTLSAPDSGAAARRQLEESASVAHALGVNARCFLSARLAIEEGLRLQRKYESTHLIDADALATLFGVSGALDMAMYRAIGPGVDTTRIAHTFEARLLGSKG
jgi:hypothetical protein